MSNARTTNRVMFWRILRRLLTSNPGRLLVILLALSTGAAVTAALLNLQLDAKRRLTTEFRAFGPNVILKPHDLSSVSAHAVTLDQAVLQNVPPSLNGQPVTVVAALYLIAHISVFPSSDSIPVVVAGYRSEKLAPPLASVNTTSAISQNESVCTVGSNVAARLRIQSGDRLTLRNAGREHICPVKLLTTVGASEDDQIAVSLITAQRLAALPQRISVAQFSVSGKPRDVETYIAAFAQKIPDADVRPIRQFTEAQAKIYNRISGLLTFTVALVLVLTGLCVMAAMTNVAIERKADVGMMKAIGGATRRVLRLFLTEAALLGLASGVLGAAAGIALSIALGKAVYGVAARPRLIVYPISVALTIIVAILSAYPLRRLAGISPAVIFRGE